MEIVVSTTIFATTVTLILVLFNYTLRINREVEQLRQVSQATRNFTEFLVREIRNGTIDYTGTIDAEHCPDTYPKEEDSTFLALVNRGGDRQCFYLEEDENGVANLFVTKKSISGNIIDPQPEKVNPDNVTLNADNFRMYIYPKDDPQERGFDGFYPGVQPFVTLVMSLTVQIGAGNNPSTILYQTTTSTDNYTILHR